MSQKEKNLNSRLYRLIRNKECSNLWRELLVFVFTISVFSFLLPFIPDYSASEPVVEIPDVKATFLSFFCGSKVNHCCLNISVRYICVDTWNADIASYRKHYLAVGLFIFGLKKHAVVFCSISSWSRETLIVDLSFGGENQTEDKQNPKTWFA